jgi:hypothetical protein
MEINNETNEKNMGTINSVFPGSKEGDFPFFMPASRRRLHFSEVVCEEADLELIATRYFPTASVSRTTEGVDHYTPLHKKITELGWKEIGKRKPYMHSGKGVLEIEFKRERSYLVLASYRLRNAVWAFVRIRGFGRDVIELRDWMQQYETGYGRMPE